MAKYSITFDATASKYMGEVEANSHEEAVKKAEEMFAEEASFSLCHQCSDIDIGDGEFKAYTLDPTPRKEGE